MKDYILVTTSENSRIEDNFIESLTFYNTLDEAVESGKVFVKNMEKSDIIADFFVYQLCLGSI